MPREEKTYTEREVMLAKREAFIAGANFRDLYCACSARKVCGAEDEAKARFPLPKVTRPRVRFDPHDRNAEWRCEAGYLQVRWFENAWQRYPRDGEAMNVTAERVRVWADLFAHPTWEVDADA